MKCDACGLMYVANPPPDDVLRGIYDLECFQRGAWSSSSDCILADHSVHSAYVESAKRLRLIEKFTSKGRILDNTEVGDHEVRVQDRIF